MASRKRRRGPRTYDHYQMQYREPGQQDREVFDHVPLTPLEDQPGALVKNAADEEQVSKAKTVEKDTIKLEKDDLLDIMESKQGQRFLARMLSQTGIHKTSIRLDRPNDTFILEGERKVGLQLLSEMYSANRQLCAHIMMLSMERE